MYYKKNNKYVIYHFSLSINTFQYILSNFLDLYVYSRILKMHRHHQEIEKNMTKTTCWIILIRMVELVTGELR